MGCVFLASLLLLAFSWEAEATTPRLSTSPSTPNTKTEFLWTHLSNSNVPVAHNVTVMHLDEKYFTKDKLLECVDDDQYGQQLSKMMYRRRKIDTFEYNRRYPNGTIPLLVQTGVYSQCQLTMIGNAMRYIEERTCIHFVPFVDQESTPNPMIIFEANPGQCASFVGMHGDSNICLIDGKVAALKTPTCGLMLLHSDCLIDNQFRNVHQEVLNVLGFVQDMESPSRYWDDCSITQYTIDKLSGLTEWDAYKINQLYQCENTARGGRLIDMNVNPEHCGPRNSLRPRIYTHDWNNCNFSRYNDGTSYVRKNAAQLTNVNNETIVFSANIEQFGAFYWDCYLQDDCAGMFADGVMIRSLTESQSSCFIVHTRIGAEISGIVDEGTSARCDEIVNFHTRTYCYQIYIKL